MFYMALPTTVLFFSVFLCLIDLIMLRYLQGIVQLTFAVLYSSMSVQYLNMSNCELTFPDIRMYMASNGSLPSSYTYCDPNFLYLYKVKSLCFVMLYTIMLAMYTKNFIIRLIR